MAHPLALALSASILAACAAPTATPPDSAPAPAAAAEATAMSDDRTAPLVLGNIRFAAGAYAQLRAGDANLFFSPYSISTALAMVEAGARGKTSEQMRATLHFPAGDYHQAFARLRTELSGRAQAGGARLSIANGLWPRRGFVLEPAYLETVASRYEAEVREADYAREPERERAAINAWVSKKTETKIPELFIPGSIDASTALALANAVYFKGTWEHEFDPAKTQDAPFTTGDGRSVTAPMMRRVGPISYKLAGDAQVLRLPYAGGQLAMYVVLPVDRRGLGALERSLTDEAFERWTTGLAETRVDVAIPRFKLSSSFLLNEMLADMGMPVVFTGQADLRGISAQGGLAISIVIHKAFVEVNEEGTEAAAATGIGITRGSAPAKPVSFTADHPFVFFIRDEASGTILFLGRVTDPVG